MPKTTAATLHDRLTISVTETSQRYGMNKDWVARLCQQGKLPAKKVLGKWHLNKNEMDKMFIWTGGEA